MSYTIYKADGTTVTVPDNAIDIDYYNSLGGSTGNGLGTQLVGRNAINYGASTAQNFLQLTENFSSSPVPSDTTSLQGQFWFNKTSAVAGNMYVRISGAGSGGIANWRKVIVDDGAGNISGDIDGNAATATALETPRTISATGDATWTVTFDGTANATGALTLATVNPNVGSYGSSTLIPVITVDGKGRITGLSTVAAAGGGGGGSGTVTSVQLSGGTTGLTSSGGPVTTAGTLTLAGTLVVANGGTGGTTQGSARSGIGAAASGANSDITSLNALTTQITVLQGGTGSSTDIGARTNLNAAKAGANSDITSLTGLTTQLALAYGGTNGTDATSARASLLAAKSGANSDITSITGLTTQLDVAYGGTGGTTQATARTGIGAAASGANADITSLTGLTTPLSISRGGTGVTVAQAIGIGQTWADYAGSRAFFPTTFNNGTTRPIQVTALGIPGVGGNYITLNINTGAGYISVDSGQGAGTETVSVSGIVPPGADYYVANSGCTLAFWLELR